MADIKVYFNGRVKYISEHLLEDPAFCKQYQVVRATEAPKIVEYVPKQQPSNDSIIVEMSEDGTVEEPTKAKPGRKAKTN